MRFEVLPGIEEYCKNNSVYKHFCIFWGATSPQGYPNIAKTPGFISILGDFWGPGSGVQVWIWGLAWDWIWWFLSWNPFSFRKILFFYQLIPRWGTLKKWFFQKSNFLSGRPFSKYIFFHFPKVHQRNKGFIMIQPVPRIGQFSWAPEFLFGNQSL